MFQFNKNSIKIVINTSSSALINVKPTSFSDVRLISKEFLKGNVVVIDINSMKGVDAIRFMDFLSGVLFTTKGSFKNIGHKIYLLAPSKPLLEKFAVEFENK